MNAKKSLIIFGAYTAWLAGIVLSFAHASGTIGEDLNNGLIWFGVSLTATVLGVFVAIKLNKKK